MCLFTTVDLNKLLVCLNDSVQFCFTMCVCIMLSFCVESKGKFRVCVCMRACVRACVRAACVCVCVLL